MNVLLFDEADEIATGRVRVTDRRLRHVREILRAKLGDSLAVGRVDGRLGRGTIRALDAHALELEVALDRDPPEALPLTLALALPRPPSLRKVLQQATALGVKRFVLFGSARVEKSYWQSTGLADAALREQLLLGLEQAGDTRLPTIALERRFRPFVEDALPGLANGGTILVAHPGPDARLPSGASARVGSRRRARGRPAGSDELARLDAVGAQRVSLGARVLRVETAVVALLARLAG